MMTTIDPETIQINTKSDRILGNSMGNSTHPPTVLDVWSEDRTERI
jgi:hypothetical protein